MVVKPIPMYLFLLFQLFLCLWNSERQDQYIYLPLFVSIFHLLFLSEKHFSSKSLRTLDCWSIERLCICLFEKYNVKINVPTIPNVCAKLSTSPYPISTISKRIISQSILIKFSIYLSNWCKENYYAGCWNWLIN